jgi:hypothetical protein
MALLHRERTEADDTVAGPVPAWPPTTTDPDVHERDRVVRRNSFGQTLRTILATLLLVAVVAVALANTGDVKVDLLYDEVTPSLAALVGGAAGAGLLIGLLLGYGRGRSRAVRRLA